MTLLTKYLKGAASLAIQSTFQRLIGIGMNVMLARWLDVASFGIFNAVINTANSGYGMVRLGVDAAIHVHMAENTRHDERVGKESILGAGLILLGVAGGVAALLCFVLADLLASTVFNRPDLGIWLKFACLLILFQCLSQFCYAALVGLHQFTKYSTVMIATAIANLVIVAAGIHFGYLKGGLVANIFANAITIVCLGYMLRLALRENHLHISVKQFSLAAGQIMRLGLPFYLSGLVAVPVSYYVQGILTQHQGIESLGFVRVLATFNNLILFIPTSVAAATISTLTQIRSDPMFEEKKFLEYTFLNIKIIWFFCLVMAVAVFVALPYLIAALFGQAYMGALPAARISVFSAVFGVLMSTAGQAYFSQRRVGLIFIQVVIFSIVLGSVGIYLIPLWGLVGYVISELAGYLAVSITTVSLLLREGGRLGINVNGALVLVTLTLGSIGTMMSLIYLFQAEVIRVAVGLFLIVMNLLIGYFFLLSTNEHARLGETFSALRRRVLAFRVGG